MRWPHIRLRPCTLQCVLMVLLLAGIVVEGVPLSPATTNKNNVAWWDSNKALRPLFDAYAAYACSDDIATWTCAWCLNKTDKSSVPWNDEAPRHVAVVSVQNEDLQVKDHR